MPLSESLSLNKPDNIKTMKVSATQKFNKKELIVFDLDGTLIRTKSPMTQEMSRLLGRLLSVKKVAIIGGGKYGVFGSLFLDHLQVSKQLLGNLFLFPTTATSFYRYQRGWKNVYAIELSAEQRDRIKKTFQRVFHEISYVHPKKTYGQLIEDRRTQVTFSVFGQDIVAVLGHKGVLMKEKWKREHTDTKMKITKLMAKYLPELEVRAAGFTSIDVTKKGIDKAYGLGQIEKHLHIRIGEMLFIGDAIYPGGNDYAVVRTGVDYIKVEGPEETKKIIRSLLTQK